MRKFFIILGILFLICLTVSILAGNITWKNVKDTSATVKKSFLKASKATYETSVRGKDAIQTKIEEIKEKRKGSN